MTGLWIAVAVLTVVSVGFTVRPLLRGAGDSGARRADYDLSVYKDQLAEVDGDLARGLLTETQAEAARTEIQRRMLAAAADGEAAAGGGNAKVLAIVLGVAVPAAALGTYMSLGSPSEPGRPFAERPKPEEAPTMESVEGMVAKLAERLEEKPDNLEGWLMLARSYGALRRYAEAADAYGTAAKLADNDPDLRLAQAEMMVMAAGETITPEAAAVFRAVVEADPTNPKGRYYMGLMKAQEGDLKGAAQDWTDLLALAPADAPWIGDVRNQITSAAKNGGFNPATIEPSAEAKALAAELNIPAQPPAAAPSGPSAADMAAAAAMTPEERQEMIRGMVERLAARLEENPADKQGWERLARAYEVMGEAEKAKEARERAARLP